jgi:hypothetical protein
MQEGLRRQISLIPIEVTDENRGVGNVLCDFGWIVKEIELSDDPICLFNSQAVRCAQGTFNK